MTQLEAVRRKLGWSQKRMGDELGVSQAAICNMENGQAMRGPVAKLFELLVERHAPESAPSAIPEEAADAAE